MTQVCFRGAAAFENKNPARTELQPPRFPGHPGYMKVEGDRWAKVIKDTGAKID